jgi:hypothetical protein
MAEGELVSLPGRGVVAEAWLCGAGRGRRDRAAACRRADHGSRAEGAAVGAPSRLGRCVACLDFAGAQALADRARPETRPLLAKAVLYRPRAAGQLGAKSRCAILSQSRLTLRAARMRAGLASKGDGGAHLSQFWSPAARPFTVDRARLRAAISRRWLEAGGVSLVSTAQLH